MNMTKNKQKKELEVKDMKPEEMIEKLVSLEEENLEYKEKLQNINLRKEYAKNSFSMAYFFTVFFLIFVFLSAAKWGFLAQFEIPASVLIAMAGTSLAAIIGLPLAVIYGLFGLKNNDNQYL